MKQAKEWVLENEKSLTHIRGGNHILKCKNSVKGENQEIGIKLIWE